MCSLTTQGHRVAEDIVGVLARMERIRELQVTYKDTYKDTHKHTHKDTHKDTDGAHP